MESSVYRRDPAGRIYGTDERNTHEPIAEPISQPIAPSSQVPVVQATYQDEQGTVYRPVAQQNSETPRNTQRPSSNEKLRLSDLRVPPAIKEFYKKLPIQELVKKLPASKGQDSRGVLIAKRIVIFYLVFFTLLGLKTSLSLEKTDATPEVHVEDTSGTNWLLIGSDSREGLTPEEQQQLHTGQDEGGLRTDTIMIVHMGKGGTTLISLPRDSYVTIPEHTNLEGKKFGETKNKINAAYNEGGAKLLVSTIEYNTGLRIDHYMEVGFRGIRDLTNAVKGVNICVPQDYDDVKSNLHVKAGCQKIDGVTALAYVRMRYADPKGDIGRIERQQQFLGAVMKKIARATTVLNPIAMYRISKAGTDSVVLGKGDGIKDVARLGLAMKGIASGKGKIATVPIATTSATTAAGLSVLWDKEAAKAFFAELAAN